jgi:hypothetical protein
MTYTEYFQIVYKRFYKTEERFGQACFNVLAEVKPDLAERVRGTKIDPFYIDERFPEFEQFLTQNLE